MPSDRPSPQLHDPRVLRAVAHPARARILTELKASGPLRAADVAAVLGIPANQASFHLRQLAKYGLIEEDPSAARDKRDRVWKLTGEAAYTVEMGRIEEAPGGRAAASVFRRTKAAWGRHLVDRAYSDEREPGTVRVVSEEAVRLTREEAQELSAELGAVVDRWAERTRGRGDERRTYLVFQIVQPYPDQPTGES